MQHNRNIKKLFKPLDYVIVFIAFTLVILSIRYTLTNKEEGAKLIVSNPETEWVYDLHANQTFGTQGPIGVSIISIQDGFAFFESSPCNNQICVHTNPIQHNAGFIACLPNQVFIRIESDKEQNNTETLDIVGY